MDRKIVLFYFTLGIVRREWGGVGCAFTKIEMLIIYQDNLVVYIQIETKLWNSRNYISYKITLSHNSALTIILHEI